MINSKKKHLFPKKNVLPKKITSFNIPVTRNYFVAKETISCQKKLFLSQKIIVFHVIYINNVVAVVVVAVVVVVLVLLYVFFVVVVVMVFVVVVMVVVGVVMLLLLSWLL